MLKLKNVKFIVLSIIFVLFLGITSCYAVDLDLSNDLEDDLLSNTNTSNTNNSSVSDNYSNTNNSSNSNTSTSNNSDNTTNSYTNTNSSSTNSTPSATVTDSMPESDLGLSNILNIFLIVIGVLLILLAISILIRLKN